MIFSTQMYDEGENVINLNVKKNKNMTDENGRYMSIETYNGNPGLPQWGYNQEEGNQTDERYIHILFFFFLKDHEFFINN